MSSLDSFIWATVWQLPQKKQKNHQHGMWLTRRFITAAAALRLPDVLWRVMEMKQN